MPHTDCRAKDGSELLYSGVVTGAEIARAKAQFFARARDEGARYVLCDFTAVERFDVSTPDVQRIVQQDRAAADSLPDLIEVVVAPRPFEYGMARMWEIQVEDVRPRNAVVRTRAEALMWLKEQGFVHE